MSDIIESDPYEEVSYFRSGSIGTENYYATGKISIPFFSKDEPFLMVHTDGVKEMAAEMEAFWIIDYVNSHVSTCLKIYKEKDSNLFVFRFHPRENKSLEVIIEEGNWVDCGGEILDYSDLKQPVQVWASFSDGCFVIYMPEEH
jgi:hypothetical protein